MGFINLVLSIVGKIIPTAMDIVCQVAGYTKELTDVTKLTGGS